MEGWAQPKTQQSQNGLVGRRLNLLLFPGPGKRKLEVSAAQANWTSRLLLESLKKASFSESCGLMDKAPGS